MSEGNRAQASGSADSKGHRDPLRDVGVSGPQPQASAADVESARVLGLVQAFSLVGVSCALGFAGYFWLALNSWIASVGLLIGAAAVAMTPALMRRSARLGAHLLTAVVLASSCFVALVRDGYAVSALVYLALAPLLAVYLLDRRQARRWTLAAGVVCVLMAAITWLDLKPIPTLAFSPQGQLVLDLLGLLGVLIIVLILALAHRTSLERSEARRHQLADRVHASQRLESIGELAGGVAHDFNNVLTVIVTTCDSALRSLDAEAPLRDDLGSIKAAAQRASSLTRQLLLFSRTDVADPVLLDCSDLIVELRPLLIHTLREDVDLVVDVETGLWPVEIDRTQLEQVLLNLTANARDAMPAGGRLQLQTRNLEVSAGHVQSLEADLDPGPHLQLRVIDNGEGMTPEVMTRAFEPFFSTKPKGIGTGLGLASVYGIVTAAGGHVHVQSSPGAGTTVTVLLPAHPEKKAEAGPQSHAPPLAEGPARQHAGVILLVEDDHAVRVSTSRLLASADYHVLAAASGEEALELFEHHRNEIGMVVSDVMMPNMNGAELAERLREIRPKVPVLFVTGYADDVLSGPGTVGAPLLQKPFSSSDLLAKVAEGLTNSDVHT